MKRTLSALLALLTALLLIRPAAAAARTVPVTVDDALLRETCYLESGSTLVPLRGLLGLLGGWTVSWQSGQAVAVSGSRAIRARPGRSRAPMPIAPSGGFKESGYGRLGGLEGLHEFSQVKNIRLTLG